MRRLNHPHHRIEHLSERFDADSKDPDWLPQLKGDVGLIIVSADPGITKDKKERAIWRDVRLTSFFFASGFPELRKWEQVAEVIRWWERIVAQARESPAGSGFLL